MPPPPTASHDMLMDQLLLIKSVVSYVFIVQMTVTLLLNKLFLFLAQVQEKEKRKRTKQKQNKNKQKTNTKSHAILGTVVVYTLCPTLCRERELPHKQDQLRDISWLRRIFFPSLSLLSHLPTIIFVQKVSVERRLRIYFRIYCSRF